MDQKSQNNSLINDSRTTWSTLILICYFWVIWAVFCKKFTLFWQQAWKALDNFEIEHKTYLTCLYFFLLGMQYPLENIKPQEIFSSAIFVVWEIKQHNNYASKFGSASLA